MDFSDIATIFLKKDIFSFLEELITMTEQNVVEEKKDTVGEVQNANVEDKSVGEKKKNRIGVILPLTLVGTVIFVVAVVAAINFA